METEGSAIGIDLGTSNSVMAHRRGSVKVLLNRENEELTPSVVGWYKGKIIKGSTAVGRAENAPEDTITSIKRLMGRAYSDPAVQKAKEKVLYRIVEPSDATAEDVRVLIGGSEHSPIEISAMILEKLKEDAEPRLNRDVTGAVITVPAYFTDKQKDATRKAGWKAGLKVKRVLDEPTAAAIAYGVDELDPEDSKIVLVYDLGGGTFDVSVLMISGGAFVQMDVEGDMWLGGDDFDQKIMDYVLQEMEGKYSGDGRDNLKFMMVLQREAEKAKKALSSMSRADVFIPDKLEDDEGDYIDVDVEITRERFERMIGEDVRSTIDLVHAAIKNAKLTIDEIDNVLLVGGSTTIPMVQRAVIDVFGEGKVLRNVDPMKCVSQGAATVAARFAEFECPECGAINPYDAEKCIECRYKFNSVVVVDVTPMALGIHTHEGKFKAIVEKGTSYPTPPVTQEFYTSASNIRKLKVPVYSYDDVQDASKLECTIWMQVPKGTPASTPVDVTFALDDDGILKKVVVKLKDGSGRMVEVEPDRGGEWTSKIEEELNETAEALEEKRRNGDVSEDAVERIMQIEDDAAEAMTSGDKERARRKADEVKEAVKKVGLADAKEEWMQKAEGLCGYSEFVVDKYHWMMDANETYKIRELMEDLKGAVEDGDKTRGERKYAELDDATDSLPDFVRILMTGWNAVGIAMDTDPLKADRLRNIISEVEADLRQGYVDSAMQAITEKLIPLANEIFEGRGEMPPQEDIKRFGGLTTKRAYSTGA